MKEEQIHGHKGMRKESEIGWGEASHVLTAFFFCFLSKQVEGPVEASSGF